MNKPEWAHSGEDLSTIPVSTLFAYGEQVSKALEDHVDTMLQYSPKQIVGIILEGRGIIVIDGVQPQKCVAFAQISPWNDDTGTPVAIEFRSWKSWSPGCGIDALYAGVRLSEQKYPGVPIYAVVEASNIKAQQKLLGAKAVIYPGMPSGMTIELGEGQAQCIVYNLLPIAFGGI